MCESNSSLSIVAYTFMVLGLSACLTAFAAPFWLVRDYAITGIEFIDTNVNNVIGSFVYSSEGLFGTCYKDNNCVWVWDNDFALEKKLPDWQKASQGLYAGGVILILFAGIIATFHACCCCCKGSFSVRTALGSLIFAAVLCVGASLTVYGIFAKKSGKLDPPIYLYWGFYLGVAGVASCLLSSVLYFMDGCMTKNYNGYHMTRVV